jgi:hypothetical protein
MGKYCNLFYQTDLQKCGRVSVNNCSLEFGLWLVSRIFEKFLTSHNPNKNRAVLWRIFSLNKSVPANRKKGFYISRLPNEEIGGIFVLSG